MATAQQHDVGSEVSLQGERHPFYSFFTPRVRIYACPNKRNAAGTQLQCIPLSCQPRIPDALNPTESAQSEYPALVAPSNLFQGPHP